MSNPLHKRRKRSQLGNAEALNVRSIKKAFAVLEAYHEGPRYQSLAELESSTGLDKSAVQRYTRTLRDLGYLQQNAVTRRYALTPRVLDLSFSYLSTNPLIERAAPILIDLRRAVRERVDLSMPNGVDVIFALRLQSKRETFAAALIGRRVPMAVSSGGRAILACLPDDEVREILNQTTLQPNTPHTKTDRAAIMREIEVARKKGYSVQCEEWRLGEIATAAAIVDRDRRPVAAVHIAGSTSEWSLREFEERFSPQVAAAAHDIRG